MEHLPDEREPFLGIGAQRADPDGFEEDVRQLAGQLLRLYDGERRVIARELHDTTAQNLAALSMNLTMLAEAIDHPERSRAILAECTSLTEECLKEVRSLSYMLYPPLLDELGLESALRAFAGLYERQTGVAVEVIVPAPIRRLTPELELGAFRIVQESLFNVHRHSGSKQAQVHLSLEDPDFKVLIRDWGRGVTAEAIAGRTVGLAGMRERARLLKGQLEIHPASPGTVVRVVFQTEQ